MEREALVAGAAAILSAADKAALRAIGRWIEEAWEYETAPRHAVKVYRWEADGVSALTGDTVQMKYWARSEVPTGKMEDMVFVAASENQVTGLLERLVQQALAGVAYMPPVAPTPYLEATIGQLVEGWIEAGGYQDNWRELLRGAINVGGQAYMQAMGWAQRLGAENETDPVLAQFGWKVRIRPLERPLVTLA